MQSEVSRRHYVQILGVSAALGVAGCTDSSDDAGTNGGGDESGSGQDDDGVGTGQDSDGTNGDGSNGSTDDTGSSTGDDTTEQPTDSPRLRDVFNWTDSYIMEMTSTEGTGRNVFYQGDSYSKWETDDMTFESYQIGGDSYSVFDGECYRYASEPLEDDFDPAEPAEDGEEYYSTGIGTIDGQDVYEFDLGDGLYFLSVSTGYPVRFVSDDGVVDFHSWGATSPISPPDMDCIEF